MSKHQFSWADDGTLTHSIDDSPRAVIRPESVAEYRTLQAEVGIVVPAQPSSHTVHQSDRELLHAAPKTQKATAKK